MFYTNHLSVSYGSFRSQFRAKLQRSASARNTLCNPYLLPGYLLASLSSSQLVEMYERAKTQKAFHQVDWSRTVRICFENGSEIQLKPRKTFLKAEVIYHHSKLNIRTAKGRSRYLRAHEILDAVVLDEKMVQWDKVSNPTASSHQKLTALSNRMNPNSKEPLALDASGMEYFIVGSSVTTVLVHRPLRQQRGKDGLQGLSIQIIPSSPLSALSHLSLSQETWKIGLQFDACATAFDKALSALGFWHKAFLSASNRLHILSYALLGGRRSISAKIAHKNTKDPR